MAYQKFQSIVWNYYKKNKRTLPWREGKINPYHVLVSEFMLQQTQVERVLPKYLLFIKKFPTLQKLAKAEQSSVLTLWSGLGYNRRALYLHKTAQEIVKKYKGKIPKEKETLKTFSGVGEYIASAVLSFAYNVPEVFIETNIRTVFIHHFFKDKTGVSDDELMPYITKTLNYAGPRDWYYALMDYGSFLKRTHGNVSRKSSHYTKQSSFAGSNRQLRGMIIKFLTTRKKGTEATLDVFQKIGKKYSKSTVQKVAKTLVSEGFLKETSIGFTLL